MRKFPGFNGMWMWMLSGDMLLGGTVCWLELGNGVPGNWWCGDLMASSGQVEKKDPPPSPQENEKSPYDYRIYEEKGTSRHILPS